MDRHLHIVCLDVPYPPDYGGIFEMYYKLKWLSAKGIKIHLHSFTYGRSEQSHLDKYCETIHYYQRSEGHKGFSFRTPYIVCSRANEELLQNLQVDNYPILLEGIHCSYYLQQNKFKNRKVILRLHNIEQIYYRQLSRLTDSLFKKAYFWNESRLLKRYEKETFKKADITLAISEHDLDFCKNELQISSASYLPAFIPWDHTLCKDGMGTFCLYHGNLSVPENEKAAIWLLENVFNNLEMPFVIAGKNPSRNLVSIVNDRGNACLVSNPSAEEMQDLIMKAHIHALPSFGITGIKYKLLNALFCGRHCVVNSDMVEKTGLETACHIAGNAEGFKSILIQLYHQPFTEDEIQIRKGLMQKYHNNAVNAERLIRWLY